MKATDTSEKGLETLIVESFVNDAGYVQGENSDYDRDHAVDLKQLTAFIRSTQPKSSDALDLEIDGPKRLQFLHRLQARSPNAV